MSIDELIAALERAEGPSRELDRGIAFSLGWAFDGNGWQEPDGTRHSGIDEYTASIDAALTLVPEGWAWHVFSDHGRTVRWAQLHSVDLVPIIRGEGASEAVALCIAALKARMGSAADAALKDTQP